MARTRIRWRNVGRVATAVGAGGLLIGVVPGMLEPPDPEPLPADVGLATGATGAHAYAPAEPARTKTEAGEPRDSEPPERKRERYPPDRHPAGGQDPPARGGGGSAVPPAVVPDPPPASAPSAPATVGPPAPAPAPASAPPEPEPPSDEPTPEPSPDHDPPSGPSQFGFEH